MCFSATASFSAGVVLSAIGIASIKKANHKSHLLFASIPLIFGVQQVAEGLVWITLPHPDLVNIQKLAAFTFLFFAQTVWPLWVPIAVFLMEKSNTRKPIQIIPIVSGLLVSGYLTYCLMTFSVEAKIRGYHIAYLQDYPVSLRDYAILLYALATIVPLFLSHVKLMWVLGVIIFTSYIVTAIFYEHYILSVWCFFSSIISIFIYLIIAETSKLEKPLPLLKIQNAVYETDR